MEGQKGKETKRPNISKFQNLKLKRSLGLQLNSHFTSFFKPSHFPPKSPISLSLSLCDFLHKISLSFTTHCISNPRYRSSINFLGFVPTGFGQSKMPFISEAASAIKSRFGFHERKNSSESSPDLLKSSSKVNNHHRAHSLDLQSVGDKEDRGDSINRSFEFNEDPSFWNDHNVQVLHLNWILFYFFLWIWIGFCCLVFFVCLLRESRKRDFNWNVKYKIRLIIWDIWRCYFECKIKV